MKKIKRIKSQEGYEFDVRIEFLKICPDPKEYTSYNLINTFKMLKYLATKEELFADKIEDLLNE